MSKEDARKVVSRAIIDDEYRGLLYSDPEKALAGYDLTEEESKALLAIPSEEVDDYANNLTERLSLSFFGVGWIPGDPDAEAYMNLQRAAEIEDDLVGRELVGEADLGSGWKNMLFRILGFGGKGLDRQNYPLMD